MKNFGLITDIIRDVNEYVLGTSKVPYVPFNESGNWEAWLPKYESQTTKLGEETSGCTVWGLQNQVETLHKFLYSEEPNYAEAFNYPLVPIDPGRGADPQRTYESVRTVGLIDQKYLPLPDTIEELLDKSNITGSLLAKGLYWLSKADYRHEWLWKPGTLPTNYKDILKDALRTCPIAVAVQAWNKQGDEYVSLGNVNNHWCLLYGIDDKGRYLVFDSYDHSRKILSADHYIGRAKRIWLQKRTKKEMGVMIKLLQSVIKSITSKMKPTLYDVAKANLGIDVTPLDQVADDIACAHTLTTLMKKVYPETPLWTGTASLYEWLLKQPTWKKTDAPDAGDIVISPTGYGSGIGHCGVLMENNLIASNTSFGINKGKFIENYTVEKWRKQYGEKQALPVVFFRRV